MEGELFVEALVGVFGSYTVAGSNTGGNEGSRGGGAVTDDWGSYTGERGRARRGLEAGERCEEWLLAVREGDELTREGEAGCGAAPWSAWAERGPAVPMLSLREKLGWCCERVLLAVLCDQRLMLPVPVPVPAPSRKRPMPSAAPLAALERRLAEGGGVARVVWGALDEDASGFASLSEAALLTVTTEDEEMEVLRDDERRCECGFDEEGAAAGSCCCVGAAAGRVCIFMLASEPAKGWCLRTKATLMQHGMQACCRCRNALGSRR